MLVFRLCEALLSINPLTSTQAIGVVHRRLFTFALAIPQVCFDNLPHCYPSRA